MNAKLVAALREACGAAAVLDDPGDVEPYVTDWRGRYVGRALAVVRPASTEQVSDVVRACAAHGAVVVPQGGNTGLATGATPLELDNAVIVSLSRMRRIEAVDARGYTMLVEAGAVLSDVHDAAARAGRYFPLSLAAEGTAQIGGLIATNAGGTAVVRYGSMRALVLGLEVVLADGRIADGLRALRKDNAGYDWKQLFIGSEGTLGIVTRAVLRLFPQPRTRVTALLGLATCDAAVDAFAALQTRLGETLTACELMPERAFALRLAHDPSLKRPIAPSPWYLLVEAASSLSALRDETEEALADLEESGLVTGVVVAENRAQQDALWAWRETITESEKRHGRSLKHDVSVAVSDVAAFVSRATETIESRYVGVEVLAFGHLGDGNVHFNVMLPAQSEVDETRLSADVYESIADFRGSITAEHGIGRYRRAELRAHRSAAEMEIMRRIKLALDPDVLMNPGAVLELGLRGEAQ